MTNKVSVGDSSRVERTIISAWSPSPVFSEQGLKVTTMSYECDKLYPFSPNFRFQLSWSSARPD